MRARLLNSGSVGEFSYRLARKDDFPALAEVMRLAIEVLQRDFLDPREIEASKAVMGLDHQLIEDATYFVIEQACNIVGCGGWSLRATLYGGSHSLHLRDPAPLDPASDAARIRAMYTHPDYKRRGVGRLIIDLCEKAAFANGFRRTELMATLAGEPLYRACGYTVIEKTCSAAIDGIKVPLLRMSKELSTN
jgi:GNAT superfamily N-acetyltransferase